MDRSALIDDEVVALILTGVLLAAYGAIPLSITYSIGTVNRAVFLAFGGLFTGAAIVVNFKRRDKRTIQVKILQFLLKRGAYPDEQGIVPSVVQQYVGVRKEFFDKYVKDLLLKGFLKWNAEKRLVLTTSSLRLLKDEDFARFFEETKEQ